MRTRSARGTIGTLTAGAALVSLVVAQAPTAVPAPDSPRIAHIDPATLKRGDNPRVAYLVRDTIRDGDRRIRVRTPGKNLALFETRSGYLVWSFVYNRNMTVVAVDRDGDRRRLGQEQIVYPVVSPDGRRVVVVKQRTPGAGPNVARVVDPRSGRMIARRVFPVHSGVLAVTDRRALVTNLGDPQAVGASTWWWNYRRDTVRRISGWTAVGADLQANKVLLDHGWRGNSDCQRVAPLKHPRRTLWRACRIFPRDWNAKGSRALATRRFWEFDRRGTDRWVVHKGRGPGATGRVTGRLDWTAVWEGNRRFLTVAQSDNGEAAIIRCRFDGRCERASKLWQIPVDNDDYYVAPPVVLAEGEFSRPG